MFFVDVCEKVFLILASSHEVIGSRYMYQIGKALSIKSSSIGVNLSRPQQRSLIFDDRATLGTLFAFMPSMATSSSMLQDRNIREGATGGRKVPKPRRG